MLYLKNSQLKEIINMPTTITSNGSGKCPVHGGTGSLYKCKKCGDVRCWSCLQKIGGANKPCAICS